MGLVHEPIVRGMVRTLGDGQFALFLFGLGYGVNALGDSMWTYALGTTAWTVGEVVGFPAASALVADFAPTNLRGRYQGAFAMMFDLAMTLGPLLGGELLARGGGRLLWTVCLGLALAVAVGQLLARGPRERRLTAWAARA